MTEDITKGQLLGELLAQLRHEWVSELQMARASHKQKHHAASSPSSVPRQEHFLDNLAVTEDRV
jgi:hypothetical protein